MYQQVVSCAPQNRHTLELTKTWSKKTLWHPFRIPSTWSMTSAHRRPITESIPHGAAWESVLYSVLNAIYLIYSIIYIFNGEKPSRFTNRSIQWADSSYHVDCDIMRSESFCKQHNVLVYGVCGTVLTILREDFIHIRLENFKWKHVLGLRPRLVSWGLKSTDRCD